MSFLCDCKAPSSSSWFVGGAVFYAAFLEGNNIGYSILAYILPAQVLTAFTFICFLLKIYVKKYIFSACHHVGKKITSFMNTVVSAEKSSEEGTGNLSNIPAMAKMTGPKQRIENDLFPFPRKLESSLGSKYDFESVFKDLKPQDFKNINTDIYTMEDEKDDISDYDKYPKTESINESEIEDDAKVIDQKID